MTEPVSVTSQAYREHQAVGYEEDPEHALFPAERQVWLDTIDAFRLPPEARLLDFGAGTGALLTALKAHGLDALGLEPSTAMIEQALVLYKELASTDIKLGDAGAIALEDGLFDLIVSRQVLCHLVQPERVFRSLHCLLKPGGLLMLVDGFWSAASWQAEQLSALPFAALTTADPVAAHLRQVGFDIVEGRLFDELNSARRGACPSSRDRYLIVAHRP